MFLLSGLLLCAAPALCQRAGAVTLTENDSAYVLGNGDITATIDKRSGGLLSLRYQGMETLDAGSGHTTGYWSHAPGRDDRTVDSITINPTANDGERAEVSIKGFYQGTALGQGPGGSAAADIEIRYAVSRGVPGVYTYSIFDHKAAYPATSIGEARFAAKLSDSVFDWMTVDANRNKEMITAYDWDHGTRLNMKEARRMTTGIEQGQVEHKYDYSANQFDTPAYGWSSSKQHIGLWFINPSDEYLSGGPTKVELTAHRDATFTDSLTAPAPPTLLNYWRGSHYGGSECDIAGGEAWTKVIGPFLIYCNSGPTPDAMWQDALAQATREAERWPYAWVSGVDYPHHEGRATVRGQLTLDDPQAPHAKMTNLQVGLAHADYGRGNGRTVDWQHDAKYYQFWVRADAQGRFTLPNVRPGAYTLHAIADGVLGEFARADIIIAPGQTLDLGRLTWTPVRYGRQLWDIGVADRSAGEFLHGDHYWQWGLYLQYPKDFPNDVHYVIGQSDYHKDWNYAEVPRSPGNDPSGRLPGAPTTWTVTFPLPDAPHGRATLRLAIAGAAGIPLETVMNGTPIGRTRLTYNATINRDGIHGDWVEKDVVFDASVMKAGTNVLTLSIPGGNVMSGVEYDYLRLELDEHAAPPTPETTP